ncbi:MAG: prolyl oligopeptidase family serine peptidase [Bacteroidia bacterium]|nr:prolyl oligopeptidase family serine peptidase [Bacteroidia bacterium]
MRNLFQFNHWIILISIASLYLSPMTEIHAQEKLVYQVPPQDMVSLIDAAPAPSVSLNRPLTWMFLAQTPSLPSIEELAQPELRLAGLRINPRTNGPSRGTHVVGLTLQRMSDGQQFEVEGLPNPLKLSYLSWAPNGNFAAFTQTTDTGLEAWLIDIEQRKARRLGDFEVNAAISGSPITWMPGSDGLLIRAIPRRGSVPVRPLVPDGPVISENDGEVAAVRTYQDLLQDRYDEAIFSYYATSELVIISVSGEESLIGKQDLYLSATPSPDGKYLLVDKLARPFSYLVTYGRFPREIEVWKTSGEFVRTITSIPNGETIPKGFMATREGPRDLDWRSDVEASLYWIEAQDGGDPAKEVPVRDKMYHLTAPFEGEPVFDLDFELRAADVTWGHGELAIVQEYWWTNRRIVTSKIEPDCGDAQLRKKVLFDRSWEDRYNDPGSFETKRNSAGQTILQTDQSGELLFLTGDGASAEGNIPFLDSYRISDGHIERLWHSEAPFYEYPLYVVDTETMVVLTRRESRDTPPNYFMRHLRSGDLSAITTFPHPYPQLIGVEKQPIRYEREDGVMLNGNLYLPPGYQPARDGRIPVLMWAYPEEFKSAEAAGQVQGSPYQFIRIGWYSPLFWLMKGYAILDDPGMPIIGEGDAEPNDNFVKQLVGNAQAAIDKLVEMGIADTDKVAVGGHSYGAFMTANLLAHSDLFACGIARSGAYNRTLTPFGFQSEERTLWEAPDVYMTMSPFMNADKIKDPILLIHGAADNNAGTYPMQSERFYNALKGHGARARLVMLPHESHGYSARESVLHMLWEMTEFMEKYLESE